MESVMNFLADYYIWFFVAAGILCFALIGFVIESRKKRKNEFKGESIDVSANTTTDVKVEASTPEVSEVSQQEVSSIPQALTQPIQSVPVTPIEPAQPSTLEDTMEINDIPLATETQGAQSTNSGIEFYSGPIEMPHDTPKPMPAPIQEEIKTSSVSAFDSYNNVVNNMTMNTPVDNTPLENNVSYEQVNEQPAEVVVQPVSGENKEQSVNTDIFGGLK